VKAFTILFVAGLCLLVWFVWNSLRRLPKNERTTQVLALLFGLIFISVNYFLSNKTTPDYVAENRPYLKPTLIVESVKSNEVYCHFDIENTGKLPAYNVRWQQKSETFSAGDNRPVSYELAPGAKMSTITLPGTKIIDSVFNMELLISYEAKVNETEASYRSAFNFLIPEYSLNPGQFFYFHNKELGENEQLLTIEDIKKQFEMDNGVVTLSLQVNKENPTASHFILSNSKRYFDFNPIKRLITFKFFNSSGTPTELKLPMKQITNGWHLIIMYWNTNVTYLSADDQKTSAPPTFARFLQ
jgi:hypothetical protein